MAIIDFSTARIAAILNTASGSCDLSSEEKVRALLTEAGITDPKLWCGGADHMEQAFSEAVRMKPDVLIVLGGDGTIRTGAEACDSSGPLLIPLPGGTMNMLPKAFYGDRTWEEALRETLAHPQVKSVSGASANGYQFFIAAIAGGPALWAQAREALREGDLQAAAEKGAVAFQNMFATKVKYGFSEENRGEADAVTVICPLISEEMEETERALEAAVITVENAGEVLGLAASGAFGKWREDKHVMVTKTKAVTLEADEEIPLILDGETMDLGKKVRIEFVPEAFKALVPRPFIGNEPRDSDLS